MRNPNPPPKKQVGQGRRPRRIAGQLELDLRGAAELTGLAAGSLRARVRRRTIPFRRLGGRILFPKDDLIAFFGALPGVTLAEARENEARRTGAE
ncbi:MAG: helix-turn-helix domain-containing protein [Acidobacteriota bacterium]|jgi:hypothetical protein